MPEEVEEDVLWGDAAEAGVGDDALRSAAAAAATASNSNAVLRTRRPISTMPPPGDW